MKGLCENCLDVTDVRGLPVGHEKGSQRDPIQEHLMLCSDCHPLLEAHELVEFAARNRTTRDITVTPSLARPT